MQCPDCGYMLSAFDKHCPRCKQYADRGLKPPSGLLIPKGIDPEPIPPEAQIRPKSAAAPAEVVFFEEGGVLVTSARAVIGGKTYAMANVTSVAGIKADADPTPGCAVFTIGGFMLFFGLVTGAPILAVFGLAALAGGCLCWARDRPQYKVRITSASGETDALWSYDADSVKQIVQAVSEAIIRRG